MRSQGRAVWRRFNRTLGEGRAPTREVADGALVLFGGALLLTPGFCTDLFGALFLLPPTRAAIRALPAAAGRAPVRRRHALRRPRRRRRAHPAPAAPARRLGRRGHRARRPRRPRAAAPVTVDPALEAPRPASGDGFSDAVTCAFGDPRADVFCVARLGLAGGAASGLVLLFHGGEPVARQGRGRRRGGPVGRLGRRGRGGLDTSVVEPLERWTLAARRRRGVLRPRAAGARRAGRARRARPRRPRGRHDGLRAALPRDGDGDASATTGWRSTASASAATRGARPTGTAWRWPGRSRPGSTTTSA